MRPPDPPRPADPVVALVTYADLPELSADDRLLARALAARGVRAVPAVWTDPAVDWRAYAAVVLRSAWDYHLHAPRFLAWVARLEGAGVPLWNPPALLRWNAEKTYLRDLLARGVAVVPTWWVEPGDATPLRGVLDAAGWDDAVVKPAVSASAHDTWRTSRAGAAGDEARFRALAAGGRVLVQPFVRAVAEEGEWSLLFFDGRYSHAVLKRPRAGDFRVQHEFGGSAAAQRPPAGVVEEAGAALAAALDAARVPAALYARVDGCVLGGRLAVMELEMLEPSAFLDAARVPAALYARVDGCVLGGRLTVMELELLEPAAFLAADPAAAGRFADAVLARLPSPAAAS